MSWTKLGDITRRYNKVTLVAGDLEVMRGWPGFEAAGFPDDEYELLDRPTLGKGFAIIPCANGRYEVSQAAALDVPAGGPKLVRGKLVQLTIRRAA